MNAPCKDCPQRHPGCWGECDNYKEWKSMHNMIKEQQHKDAILTSYKRDRYNKLEAKAYRNGYRIKRVSRKG